jgi:hypothetical protein
MHNLVHTLIGNAKLARKIGLRDASSMSSADNNIAFADSESEIRRRGNNMEEFEKVGNGC